MRDTATLAKQCGCRLHTHLAETHDEDRFCVANLWPAARSTIWKTAAGCTTRPGSPTASILMTRKSNASARPGSASSHCPTSNMVLASGHCRTLELEAAGVAVGLGVDGSASNDNSNLMEGVRHALMMNRLIYGAEKVTHFDAFRWATEGSARCLGRDKLGKIAPGYQADIAMFTLDELRFSGAGDPACRTGSVRCPPRRPRHDPRQMDCGRQLASGHRYRQTPPMSMGAVARLFLEASQL